MAQVGGGVCRKPCGTSPCACPSGHRGACSPTLTVVAFDPGPTECGWAIVQAGAAAMRGMVAFVEGGKVDSKMAELLAVVRRAVRGEVQPLVALEAPSGFIFESGSKRGEGHGAIGKQLLATAMVAGEIKGLVRTPGRDLPLVAVNAATWRRAVCGRNNADNHLVEAAVSRLTIGLPKRTNNHLRDAVGLAIFASWNPRLSEDA